MTLEELAATCDRLARTQRNLPVPLSEAERDALREAAKKLLSFAQVIDALGRLQHTRV